MFPPNLQKNIRELDRQISLLETECENIESEKKESASGAFNSKVTIREFPNKPFITGPSRSACFYKVKNYSPVSLSLSPTLPTVASFSTENHENISSIGKIEIFNVQNHQKNVENNPVNNIVLKYTEKEENFNEQELEKTSPGALALESINKKNFKEAFQCDQEKETYGMTVVQKSIGTKECETKKSVCQRSIGSIKEVSESTDESSPETKNKLKFKNCATSAKSTQSCIGPPQYKSDYKNNSLAKSVKWNSSEEELRNEKSDKWLGISDHSIPIDFTSFKKNRPRSVRTKKKCSVPLDLNMNKNLMEKEIQCVLWSEEKEKEDFISNLNTSIKNLHFLIGELKNKSSDGKENDTQNTLTRLGHIKSPSTFNSSLNLFASLQSSWLSEENSIDVKKTFFSIKQFCEQIYDEKSFLSDELTARNRTIASMKNKEKEYLSAISTLKYNLEKTKDQAQEYNQTKAELALVKNKLNEEAKVIEALKKNHAKLQDLVENYVLENDKLRAQLKIAKLESHKFNVLLAGKEEEIKKYKYDMGSFQRQICEQLNHLRSKASEVQVDTTIRTIANQSSIPSQTENESLQTELNDFSERVTFSSSKTSLGSIWSGRIRNNDDEMNSTSTFQDVEPKAITTEEEYSTLNLRPTEDMTNDVDYTSCKSDESETDQKRIEKENKFQSSFQGLINSKKLRSNIDDILQDMKIRLGDNGWTTSLNTFESAQKTRICATGKIDATLVQKHNEGF